MVTKKFRATLLVRFTAYLFVFIGLSAIIFQFGPFLIAEFKYRRDQILGITHKAPPTIITSAGIQEVDTDATSTTTFGQIKSSQNIIKPVSTDYGIVIEKINANAKVVPAVDPGSEKEYTKALSQGVAEALGSTPPGTAGNLFIFSHSADAPWNIARLNAVFYLLKELVPGDRVILYYQGRRYDYLVFDKQVVAPSDLSFLANRYDKPVLTLQTCDPPGTLLNRLIVRAQLQGS